MLRNVKIHSLFCREGAPELSYNKQSDVHKLCTTIRARLRNGESLRTATRTPQWLPWTNIRLARHARMLGYPLTVITPRAECSCLAHDLHPAPRVTSPSTCRGATSLCLECLPATGYSENTTDRVDIQTSHRKQRIILVYSVHKTPLNQKIFQLLRKHASMTFTLHSSSIQLVLVELNA